jgi:hypothetical protein
MEHRNKSCSDIQRYKAEHVDLLEDGCKVTCMNEVNGRSVSETCLVHPKGIKVTNETSVSVGRSNNNNNAIEDNRSQWV